MKNFAYKSFYVHYMILTVILNLKVKFFSNLDTSFIIFIYSLATFFIDLFKSLLNMFSVKKVFLYVKLQFFFIYT